MRNAAAPPGRPEERTNAQTDTENAEQILRRRGRFHRRGGGGKVARGASTEKKMLINDERSRNVYENKQKDDTFTDKKGDISTQRSDIFYRSTRILLKPSGFLSRFERWGTNSTLQNAETRDGSRRPPLQT